VSELRYLPFGETRWAWGVTPTDRRYTGQRELAGVGLYDYNARMYWPAAGRFVSADTVVPGLKDPQAFNRYAYVRNSPVNRVDPTGHADTCNSALYNCGGYGNNDPFITSPTPEMAPGVANGNPYIYLQQFVADPNLLHVQADYWARIHPHYDPFSDPNRYTTNWMGQSIPQPHFDYVRSALARALLAHGRAQEASLLHGLSIDSWIQLGGTGIYCAATILNYRSTGQWGWTGQGTITLSNGKTIRDGDWLSADDALDAASRFLGPGYVEKGPGRFVSSDGLRQVRMLEVDLTKSNNHAGAPHINFEVWAPIPTTPNRLQRIENLHVFINNP